MSFRNMTQEVGSFLGYGDSDVLELGYPNKLSYVSGDVYRS